MFTVPVCFLKCGFLLMFGVGLAAGARMLGSISSVTGELTFFFLLLLLDYIFQLVWHSDDRIVQQMNDEEHPRLSLLADCVGLSFRMTSVVWFCFFLAFNLWFFTFRNLEHLVLLKAEWRWVGKLSRYRVERGLMQWWSHSSADKTWRTCMSFAPSWCVNCHCPQTPRILKDWC